LTAKSRLVPEVDFDAPGAQYGFVRLFHSVHRSAYGYIPIPIVVLQNGAGPTALFVSGTHGDEYEGQVALCNLARTLKPEMIHGRVILLPAANLPAAIAGLRTSPIDDGNLNRVFPGDPEGSVTEQIAYFVEHELVRRADLVVDLHSGGSSLNYVPSALMTQDDENPARQAALLAALRAFASPISYIGHAQPGQGAMRTTGGAAQRHGKLALGTELGGSGTVSAAGLQIAERGLRNVLAHMGILPSTAAEAGPTRILDVGGPDYFVYAPAEGLFEPLVEPGDTVQAGQPAARIHTPETPWAPAETVHFARDGFVLCKRVPGRTVRGDCLFHLGSDTEW
jgi:predicted deacylase